MKVDKIDLLEEYDANLANLVSDTHIRSLASNSALVLSCCHDTLVSIDAGRILTIACDIPASFSDSTNLQFAEYRPSFKGSHHFVACSSRRSIAQCTSQRNVSAPRRKN
jgi:hypothetical protein